MTPSREVPGWGFPRDTRAAPRASFRPLPSAVEPGKPIPVRCRRPGRPGSLDVDRAAPPLLGSSSAAADAFATCALELKDHRAVTPVQLMGPRRALARKTALWTTAGVVVRRVAA
jgi:hypothetical protein